MHAIIGEIFMGYAELAAPHLPFLRRFARALTGSQKSGDAYVVALLETLANDPDGLAEVKASPRIGIYKMLCSLWQSVGLNLQANPPDANWEKAAQDTLATIGPRQRQAFLLTAVEGFSPEEASRILQVDTEKVNQLLDEATKQMAETMATDVMIVEDEPLIAMDIEDIVTSLGHCVTGIARTRREAVKLAAQKPPRLILADINLADGSSGIDAVNDMLQGISVPVIFITAYPERLLTGQRPEPAFLITKPFLPEMVKAMISQALFFDAKSSVNHAA